MERLTFKDEFGRYIYSPDTDLGEVIDRLAWYENLLSDVTPNVKAKWIRYPIAADLDPFPDIKYQCPLCYKSFKEEYDECPNCGQKLDWSE